MVVRSWQCRCWRWKMTCRHFHFDWKWRVEICVWSLDLTNEIPFHFILISKRNLFFNFNEIYIYIFQMNPVDIITRKFCYNCCSWLLSGDSISIDNHELVKNVSHLAIMNNVNVGRFEQTGFAESVGIRPHLEINRDCLRQFRRPLLSSVPFRQQVHFCLL